MSGYEDAARSRRTAAEYGRRMRAARRRRGTAAYSRREVRS
ncbi:hypothetical protein GGE06_004336 [Streptomyces sp. SFB5A]|uniref:Uncharacterized protein n=1 Tax=Streptomyces nymphaeiformis TaxID=2663842 RepID=A0A7W7U1Q7_9ACTN|nr:hypothetical protein [Streptomyces nymphaeiformis]